MALGTNYARTGRARDLMVMAKIAYINDPPDLEKFNRCIHLLRTEFSASHSRKFIRSIEKMQEKIDAERISNLRGEN